MPTLTSTTTRLAGFGVVLVASWASAPASAHRRPRAHPPRPKPPPRWARASWRPRRLPPRPTHPSSPGRRQVPLRDRGPGRRAVTRFTPIHERDLHLIVVNRELTDYHHVHPTLATRRLVHRPPRHAPAPTGPSPTSRSTAGRGSPSAPTSASPATIPNALPEPRRTTEADGYDVSTHRGRKGGEVTARLTVRRHGQPVADLQPYLGANGHLVAMRTGDLAYAHVHPVDEDGGPPAEGPSPSTLPRCHRSVRPVLRLPARRTSSTPPRSPSTRAPSPAPDMEMTMTTTRLHQPYLHRRSRHRRHDLRLLRRPDHQATQQARRRRRNRELRHRAGHRHQRWRHDHRRGDRRDRSDRLHGHTRLERTSTRTRRRRRHQRSGACPDGLAAPPDRRHVLGIPVLLCR